MVTNNTIEKNYGLIIAEPSKLDYYFGAIGAREKYDRIKYMPTGDWESHLSMKEVQHSIYFDTMACVTFSALNVLEAIFNFKLKNGLFTAEQVNFLEVNGYIVNGRVEFSDRYIAKLSNTTKDGNTGRKVADSIRHYGLVPESKYPYPVDQRTPVFDWDDYYKEVPQELLDLGEKFLEFFQLNYEVVWSKNFDDALVYSPIQVYVYAWAQNEDGLYYKPEDKRYNHATMKFNRQPQIFDHYEPFIKNLVPDYDYYASGFIWFVNNKNMENNNIKILKDNQSSSVGFWIPATNENALESYGDSFGKTIPKDGDGNIEWEQTIEGTFDLK